MEQKKNLIPAIPIQSKKKKSNCLMTLWGFAVIAEAKGKQDADWVISVSTKLEGALSDYEWGEW